ncbi:hypothetical protein L218DRAFT_1009030 [Marasmius fiardii PR-910]|nr:hypothetical protein L218DRAFT_1009030 [Marasmius fiardii PR-910]
MAMDHTRALIFHYKPGDLSHDVQVVLTFRKPTDSEPGPSQSRVAWRVVKLKAIPGSSSTAQFNIDFSGRLGFGIEQVTNGNLIIPQLMIEMKPGQSTILSLSGSNPVWSEPNGNNGSLIQAINDTGALQDIAFGIVNNKQTFSTLSPTFLWKIGPDRTAEAKFSPELMMYANLDLQESGVIPGDVEQHLLWEMNLAALESVTHWAFTETPKGHYEVTPML